MQENYITPTEEAQTAKKRITAYHEAGHVVACVIRDVPFDLVTIVGTDEYFGVCRLNLAMARLGLNMGNQSREFRSMAYNSVIVSLSGPAAEEYLTGGYDESGSADDFADAYVVARHYSRYPDEYTKKKFREARKMIIANWEQVEIVANALLEYETLDRESVLKMLGREIE